MDLAKLSSDTFRSIGPFSLAGLDIQNRATKLSIHIFTEAMAISLNAKHIFLAMFAAILYVH